MKYVNLEDVFEICSDAQGIAESAEALNSISYIWEKLRTLCAIDIESPKKEIYDENHLEFRTAKEAMIFIDEHREIFNYHPTEEATKMYSKSDLSNLWKLLYNDLPMAGSRKVIIRTLTQYTWNMARTLAFSMRGLKDLDDK